MADKEGLKGGGGGLGDEDPSLSSRCYSMSAVSLKDVGVGCDFKSGKQPLFGGDGVRFEGSLNRKKKGRADIGSPLALDLFTPTLSRAQSLSRRLENPMCADDTTKFRKGEPSLYSFQVTTSRGPSDVRRGKNGAIRPSP